LETTAELVTERARVEAPAGLTAIAVNNRFTYYALAYYGRAYFREPGAAPLTSWMLTGKPENQAESSAPLDVAHGRRVLGVIYEGNHRDLMMGDFTRVLGRELDSVFLDRKHQRRIELFVGEGFNPRPRDPVTGRPTPP